MFYADLHIHSKFSRATSRDCDLEHLAQAAARKGIGLLGTGDFTHPGWWEELRTKLVPAEPGLYRLRPELEKKALRNVPVAQPEPVRFVLQVEIATIYKKAGQTRKVHHLIYVSELDEARKLTEQLARLGNVASDGRPILGLDSRSLLELVLQTGPGCYLAPAHVWTPWFSVFGAHSGFDRLEECYEDLSGEVFALETGLSSDPPMNWRWSALDRFTLISNSDAHSPAKLGRECCVFDCPVDYFAIREALRTGQGYAGTVEFFPEEGKYHLDGHRQCGVCWEPSETRKHGGRCPRCGRPVTLGVLYRVCQLADRSEPPQPLPRRAAPFRSLIPLCEILGEILQAGPDTKGVVSRYEELLARLGPELWILEHAPLEQIARHGGQLLAEAIRRMRSGQVIRQAGFDGQYGVIRLFTDEELRNHRSGNRLLCQAFPLPEQDRPAQMGTSRVRGNTAHVEPSSSLCPPGDRFATGPAERELGSSERVGAPPLFSVELGGEGRGGSPGQAVPPPSFAAQREGPGDLACGANRPEGTARSASGPSASAKLLFPPSGEWLLAGLDPEQRAAVQCVEGPVLILAGPGTGKTRTLTHRIAYLVAEHGVPPEGCLAITFSRRAAAEMRSRLERLIPAVAERMPVMTFHAFGWQLVREYGQRLSASAGQKSFSSGEEGLSGGQEAFPGGQAAIAVPLSERFGTNWDRFCVASEAQRRELLQRLLNLSAIQADRILKKISLAKRSSEGAPKDSKLQEAFRVYQGEMARRGWLDFDDLVLLPLEILRADSAWQAELQQRFRYLSVDEFQDIDGAQYGLLRTLAPPGGNLCVIGDPDQAIYGFRGADVGFFERFLADYPTARRFVLRRNYRSSRVIVEAAGQMIAPASWTPNRRLEAEPGKIPHVEIHTCPTDRAEAELVVHRIEQLLGGPTFFSLDSRRSEGQQDSGRSFSDIAVLYRTESQAGPLVEALARSGMPFQVCSHRPLVEWPGVQKLLQELSSQTDSAGPLSERVRRLLEAFCPTEYGPAPEQGPDDRPEQTVPSFSPAIRAALLRLADNCGDDLAQLLAETAMTTEADLWDARAERISLLTLHAAKGLEFPVVFIVGCEDGVIPLRFSAEEEPARLTEERRLLFVGMTRAKEHLILTHARRRHWQGKLRPMEPSPFLADVQRELLAFHEHRPTARRTPDAQRELFS